METVTQLLEQHAHLITSMYREGILDNKFVIIHNIRDPDHPELVKELVSMFYRDWEKRLQDVATELQKQQVNYGKIDEIIHGIRATSSNFGTRRLVNGCDALRICYDGDNFEGCVKCLKHLKDEFFLLKRRLEPVFQLEHQIRAVGGIVSITEFPHQKIKRRFNPKCCRVYGD